MLFAADAAMYAAKTAGEQVSYYSPTAGGDRRKRLEIAEDLYTALDNDELTVEYQPIMTADGRLEAAEALVRWDHPTKGRLSPAEFLDIAERYRLTPAIAARVLDVALTDLGRWRADGRRCALSVNVSASDLRDEKLVDIVASALLDARHPALGADHRDHRDRDDARPRDRQHRDARARRPGRPGSPSTTTAPATARWSTC